MATIKDNQSLITAFNFPWLLLNHLTVLWCCRLWLACCILWWCHCRFVAYPIRHLGFYPVWISCQGGRACPIFFIHCTIQLSGHVDKWYSLRGPEPYPALRSNKSTSKNVISLDLNGAFFMSNNSINYLHWWKDNSEVKPVLNFIDLKKKTWWKF